MAKLESNSQGSLWHRWDPHIHTPQTTLSNEFKGDWKAFYKKINEATPITRALGVTDYCGLRGYREVREYWQQGGLPNVQLVFPNIEFRLTIETDRRVGINVHLLFSPDDNDHIERIEDVLGRLKFDYDGQTYHCRERELIRFGRAYDPSQTDDLGAYRTAVNQFKVTFRDLADILKDKWVSDNCLFAVAAAEDGTSGLQKDSSFNATRTELERKADIIFSGKPSDRLYWLGLKHGFDEAYIVGTYGGLKPCLHGSDAHTLDRVANPDNGRYCWIKAEVTFEGLRQTRIEPEARVFIGDQAPASLSSHHVISALRFSNANWLSQTTIELNPGLVAVIGPRGAGKTALADMIAFASNAYEADSGQASFIKKAADLIEGTTVKLEWADGRQEEQTFGDHWRSETEVSSVRYLSQQFVERLCTADGLDNSLLAEIEGVVFRALDVGDRLLADDFDELRRIETEWIKDKRVSLEQTILDLSKQIADQETAKKSIPGLKNQCEALDKEFASFGEELKTKVVTVVETTRLTQLEAIKIEVQAVERDLASARLCKNQLNELEQLARTAAAEHSLTVAGWKQRLSACALTEEEWAAFEMRYIGDVTGMLIQKHSAIDRDLRRIETGEARTTSTPPGTIPRTLVSLRAEAKRLQDAIGVDSLNAKKCAELNEAMLKNRQRKEALDKTLKDAEKADERRRALAEKRWAVYEEIFVLVNSTQAVLERLYAPLRSQIKANGATASKLEFHVHRKVDVREWVSQGEALLDLRKKGPFQGRGSLQEAVEPLIRAWQAGTPSDIVRAMRDFVTQNVRDIKEIIAQDATLVQFAEWLFSTNHIRLEYGIRYDGVDIENLSPGTRGIVLLVLYLAIDEWDARPIIIDQPEENLDPQSVYDELVNFFRATRSRRQIIIVTHNANLVVNTDADQIIVASAQRGNPDALPTITYHSGALEDNRTRTQVCRILEGGERAFLQRERRYSLRQYRLQPEGQPPRN